MAIFAVLAEKPNAELELEIAKQFPTDFLKITETQWLVSADTIAQSLAEQLDIRAGKFGRVVVLRTSGSASGWHMKSVWEWLTQKRTTAAE